MNRQRSRPKPVNVAAKLAELRSTPDVRFRRHGESRWKMANLVDTNAEAIIVRLANGGVRDLSRTLYETEQPVIGPRGGEGLWEPLV